MAELIAQLDRSRVKIPLRTPDDDALGFLTEAEWEESLKADHALEAHKKSIELALVLILA